MQVTNIRDHRIRWRTLLALGAVVGVISSAAMLAIAMLLVPMFTADADSWSFLKVVGSVVMGEGAAEPLAGFEGDAVLVGLLTHFAIGAVAGMTYALLVAMFDLEGWTPVALFGLLYGAILFVWSTALIGAGITPDSTDQLPMIVMFWGNITFGLTAGVLLAGWADRADIDQRADERIPVFEDLEGQPPLLH